MNKIISNVLKRKNEIINKTMNYENFNIHNPELDNYQQYSEICDFFNTNFDNNEIMVVQSIMYFGRDCFPDSECNYKGTVDEIIKNIMYELDFTFGEEIDKEIEIHQMVEKGIKIGTYFKIGFDVLNKR